MKKIAILAVLAAMVLGFAGTASAVDLDAKGQFQFQMNLIDNGNLISDKHKDGGDSEDDLNFWFRARAQFRFIANENLWAVLYTEYKTRLGNGGLNESDTGDDDNSLAVKNAYLQYRFPGTEVLTTAGIKNTNLPGAAAGNAVFGDVDAGIFMVETPITDQIAIAAAFIRYDDDYINDTTSLGAGTTSQNDELDVYFAALPITIDGMAATPYFAYANVGDKSDAPASLLGPAFTALNKDASAWWLGTSFEMDMFDPIVVAADIVYGSVDADQKHNDRSGLLFDASVAYTGLDFVQPKMVFAYSTGEDDKTSNGSERLPVINNDWAFGSSYFGGSGLTGDDVDLNSNNQVGLWTLGLSLEKISFFEKLSHDIHFLYIQGTNDKDLIKNNNALAGISADGKFLTTKDYAYEVDFNTNYQIYDELAAVVEFSYVNVDLDDDTWENWTGNGDLKDKQDPYLKFAVGLVYKF